MILKTHKKICINDEQILKSKRFKYRILALTGKST